MTRSLTAPATASRLSRRVRGAGRVLAWLLGLWLLLVVLVFGVAPPLARSVLTQQLSEVLARKVSIEQLSINPLTWTVQVDGLTVEGQAGQPLMGFGQLRLDFSVASLVRGAWVLDEVRLIAPQLNLLRLADGHDDVSKLLDHWRAPGQPGPTALPRFSIHQIQISDGRIVLDDRPRGLRLEANDLALKLPFISSVPEEAQVWVKPELSVSVNGARLTLHGQSRPFAPSHDSTLQLQVQDLDLAKLQPYGLGVWPDAWPVGVASGRLNSDLGLALSRSGEGQAQLQLSGTAELRALELSDAAGRPFMQLDQLDVGVQEAEPLKGLWALETVRLQGLRWGPGTEQAAGPGLSIGQLVLRQGRLDVTGRRLEAASVHGQALDTGLLRRSDGALQWVAWPQRPSSASAASAPAAPSEPDRDWEFRAEQLRIDDSALRFEDQTPARPALQQWRNIQLSIDRFDSAPQHPNAFTLSATGNPSGKLQATGTFQRQPLALKFELETRAIPLSPLQAYIEPYLRETALQGLVSGRGVVQVMRPGPTWQATYQGELSLNQFKAIDTADQTELLQWKSLYLGAMDVALHPLALNIGEVALSDFDTRLILHPDGHLNLAERVQRPPASDVAGAGQKDTATRPLPLQIAKVTLQNGRVFFSDRFIRPSYSAHISRLGGSIRNLSSAPDTLADLDLRGLYSGHAPVQMVARLNPLAQRKFLDLQAEVKSIDLVALSPYSAKYAGYNIDKGKLSLQANYTLQDRQLTADNRLFIDQLTFGERVDSPQATELPVHLAIALLRNNRGEIDIHLPISGSLDDPQFSIGGLIFKVMGNLLAKAVTSPFAWLGSLFGTQEVLSEIVFAPGRADLEASAVKTLSTLAKAMRERESLKLGIRGGADAQHDAQGLRVVALERLVQAQHRKASEDPRREAGREQALLSPDEAYARDLTQVYRQARFPKPRDGLGLPKDLPVAEMEKLLLTQLPVSEEDLRELAQARAQAAQNWLVDQGGLSPGRLFLQPVELQPPAAAAEPKRQHKVHFSLH